MGQLTREGCGVWRVVTIMVGCIVVEVLWLCVYGGLGGYEGMKMWAVLGTKGLSIQRPAVQRVGYAKSLVEGGCLGERVGGGMSMTRGCRVGALNGGSTPSSSWRQALHLCNGAFNRRPPNRPTDPTQDHSSEIIIPRSKFSRSHRLNHIDKLVCRGRRARMVEIDGEWDFWKLEDAVEAVKNGGIVVLPSDSCYVFVANVKSKDAVSKIYALKNIAPTTEKPLSLLCHSISQISEYTYGIESKSMFKLIKSCLPGPYTFIMSASNNLPKQVIDHKTHKKLWRRKEIGIRMPDEAILLEFIKKLEAPLLCSSVPIATDSNQLAKDGLSIFEEWKSKVDFIVHAGIRDSMPSTVVDISAGDGSLSILREGAGDISILEPYIQ